MPVRKRTLLTRRQFITTAASAAAASVAGGIAKPYLSRAADRPLITHGIQSGDVSTDSGVVWARTDRPARMLVETATTESFNDIHSAVAIDALPESDFTAKVLLENLPAGQDIFYRVRFEDLAAPTIAGEAQIGRFRTAPNDRRDVSFVWSGDTAGQGWGIDEARGGMRTYATMRNNRPDFFIHSGDSIYADCPIQPHAEAAERRDLAQHRHRGEVARRADARRLSRQLQIQSARRASARSSTPRCRCSRNGTTTRSPTTGGRARPAPTTPTPTPRCWRRAAAARSANSCRCGRRRPTSGRIYRKISYGPLLDVFLLDMRSYRGPNDHGRDATFNPACQILGPDAGAWLKRELAASNATWKVIAADLPISIVSEDAVAQGDGPPLGREFEIADLLSFIKHAGVRNTVWITADMHYTAAHYYDPNRAAFQDFEPFWEFVSGPDPCRHLGRRASSTTRSARR